MGFMDWVRLSATWHGNVMGCRGYMLAYFPSSVLLWHCFVDGGFLQKLTVFLWMVLGFYIFTVILSTEWFLRHAHWNVISRFCLLLGSACCCWVLPTPSDMGVTWLLPTWDAQTRRACRKRGKLGQWVSKTIENRPWTPQIQKASGQCSIEHVDWGLQYLFVSWLLKPTTAR